MWFLVIFSIVSSDISTQQSSLNYETFCILTISAIPQQTAFCRASVRCLLCGIFILITVGYSWIKYQSCLYLKEASGDKQGSVCFVCGFQWMSILNLSENPFSYNVCITDLTATHCWQYLYHLVSFYHFYLLNPWEL